MVKSKIGSINLIQNIMKEKKKLIFYNGALTLIKKLPVPKLLIEYSKRNT
jgi:hypothetical protein